jgi:hypothetical protein
LKGKNGPVAALLRSTIPPSRNQKIAYSRDVTPVMSLGVNGLAETEKGHPQKPEPESAGRFEQWI